MANRLSLNITKTELMTIGSRQRFNATRGNISIKIDRVDAVNSMRLHIEKHLSCYVHIERISKKIVSAIGVLKRIRPFKTTKTALKRIQL